MRWARRHPVISTIAGGVILLFVLAGILGSSPPKSPTRGTSARLSTRHALDHAKRKGQRSTTSSTTKHLSRYRVASRSKGLGATKAAFGRENNTHAPSNLAGASPGLSWYSIDSTNSRGLVTSYSVTENATPPMSDAERMSLLAGIDLPGPPAAIVKSTSTCVDYRDTKLVPLVGAEYAEASTITGSTTATMQAVRSPGCE